MITKIEQSFPDENMKNGTMFIKNTKTVFFLKVGVRQEKQILLNFRMISALNQNDNERVCIKIMSLQEIKGVFTGNHTSLGFLKIQDISETSKHNQPSANK